MPTILDLVQYAKRVAAVEPPEREEEEPSPLPPLDLGAVADEPVGGASSQRELPAPVSSRIPLPSNWDETFSLVARQLVKGLGQATDPETIAKLSHELRQVHGIVQKQRQVAPREVEPVEVEQVSVVPTVSRDVEPVEVEPLVGTQAERPELGEYKLEESRLLEVLPERAEEPSVGVGVRIVKPIVESGEAGEPERVELARAEGDRRMLSAPSLDNRVYYSDSPEGEAARAYLMSWLTSDVPYRVSAKGGKLVVDLRNRHVAQILWQHFKEKGTLPRAELRRAGWPDGWIDTIETAFRTQGDVYEKLLEGGPLKPEITIGVRPLARGERGLKRFVVGLGRNLAQALSGLAAVGLYAAGQKDRAEQVLRIPEAFDVPEARTAWDTFVDIASGVVSFAIQLAAVRPLGAGAAGRVLGKAAERAVSEAAKRVASKAAPEVARKVARRAAEEAVEFAAASAPSLVHTQDVGEFAKEVAQSALEGALFGGGGAVGAGIGGRVGQVAKRVGEAVGEAAGGAAAGYVTGGPEEAAVMAGVPLALRVPGAAARVAGAIKPGVARAAHAVEGVAGRAAQAGRGAVEGVAGAVGRVAQAAGGVTERVAGAVGYSGNVFKDVPAIARQVNNFIPWIEKGHTQIDFRRDPAGRGIAVFLVHPETGARAEVGRISTYDLWKIQIGARRGQLDFGVPEDLLPAKVEVPRGEEGEVSRVEAVAETPKVGEVSQVETVVEEPKAGEQGRTFVEEPKAEEEKARGVEVAAEEPKAEVIEVPEVEGVVPKIEVEEPAVEEKAKGARPTGIQAAKVEVTEKLDKLVGLVESLGSKEKLPAGLWAALLPLRRSVSLASELLRSEKLSPSDLESARAHLEFGKVRFEDELGARLAGAGKGLPDEVAQIRSALDDLLDSLSEPGRAGIKARAELEPEAGRIEREEVPEGVGERVAEEVSETEAIVSEVQPKAPRKAVARRAKAKKVEEPEEVVVERVGAGQREARVEEAAEPVAIEAAEEAVGVPASEVGVPGLRVEFEPREGPKPKTDVEILTEDARLVFEDMREIVRQIAGLAPRIDDPTGRFKKAVERALGEIEKAGEVLSSGISPKSVGSVHRTLSRLSSELGELNDTVEPGSLVGEYVNVLYSIVDRAAGSFEELGLALRGRPTYLDAERRAGMAGEVEKAVANRTRFRLEIQPVEVAEGAREVAEVGVRTPTVEEEQSRRAFRKPVERAKKSAEKPVDLTVGMGKTSVEEVVGGEGERAVREPAKVAESAEAATRAAAEFGEWAGAFSRYFSERASAIERLGELVRHIDEYAQSAPEPVKGSLDRLRAELQGVAEVLSPNVGIGGIRDALHRTWKAAEEFGQSFKVWANAGQPAQHKLLARELHGVKDALDGALKAFSWSKAGRVQVPVSVETLRRFGVLSSAGVEKLGVSESDSVTVSFDPERFPSVEIQSRPGRSIQGNLQPDVLAAIWGEGALRQLHGRLEVSKTAVLDSLPESEVRSKVGGFAGERVEIERVRPGDDQGSGVLRIRDASSGASVDVPVSSDIQEAQFWIKLIGHEVTTGRYRRSEAGQVTLPFGEVLDSIRRKIPALERVPKLFSLEAAFDFYSALAAAMRWAVSGESGKARPQAVPHEVAKELSDYLADVYGRYQVAKAGVPARVIATVEGERHALISRHLVGEYGKGADFVARQLDSEALKYAQYVDLDPDGGQFIAVTRKRYGVVKSPQAFEKVAARKQWTPVPGTDRYRTPEGDEVWIEPISDVASGYVGMYQIYADPSKRPEVRKMVDRLNNPADAKDRYLRDVLIRFRERTMLLADVFGVPELPGYVPEVKTIVRWGALKGFRVKMAPERLYKTGAMFAAGKSSFKDIWSARSQVEMDLIMEGERIAFAEGVLREFGFPVKLISHARLSLEEARPGDTVVFFEGGVNRTGVVRAVNPDKREVVVRAALGGKSAVRRLKFDQPGAYVLERPAWGSEFGIREEEITPFLQKYGIPRELVEPLAVTYSTADGVPASAPVLVRVKAVVPEVVDVSNVSRKPDELQRVGAIFIPEHTEVPKGYKEVPGGIMRAVYLVPRGLPSALGELTISIRKSPGAVTRAVDWLTDWFRTGFIANIRSALRDWRDSTAALGAMAVEDSMNNFTSWVVSKLRRQVGDVEPQLELYETIVPFREFIRSVFKGILKLPGIAKLQWGGKVSDPEFAQLVEYVKNLVRSTFQFKPEGPLQWALNRTKAIGDITAQIIGLAYYTAKHARELGRLKGLRGVDLDDFVDRVADRALGYVDPSVRQAGGITVNVAGKQINVSSKELASIIAKAERDSAVPAFRPSDLAPSLRVFGESQLARWVFLYPSFRASLLRFLTYSPLRYLIPRASELNAPARELLAKYPELFPAEVRSLWTPRALQALVAGGETTIRELARSAVLPTVVASTAVGVEKVADALGYDVKWELLPGTEEERQQRARMAKLPPAVTFVDRETGTEYAYSLTSFNIFMPALVTLYVAKMGVDYLKEALGGSEDAAREAYRVAAQAASEVLREIGIGPIASFFADALSQDPTDPDRLARAFAALGESVSRSIPLSADIKLIVDPYFRLIVPPGGRVSGFEAFARGVAGHLPGASRLLPERTSAVGRIRQITPTTPEEMVGPWARVASGLGFAGRVFPFEQVEAAKYVALPSAPPRDVGEFRAQARRFVERLQEQGTADPLEYELFVMFADPEVMDKIAGSQSRYDKFRMRYILESRRPERAEGVAKVVGRLARARSNSELVEAIIESVASLSEGLDDAVQRIQLSGANSLSELKDKDPQLAEYIVRTVTQRVRDENRLRSYITAISAMTGAK